MSSFSVWSLAVPAVVLLISFLSLSSQLLLRDLEPGPLDFREEFKFNGLVFALLVCYYRACSTHPGYIFSDNCHKSDDAQQSVNEQRSKGRWCSKCEKPKLLRAHHCKTCQRCIPKMDHHCPWTANCVSHVTFPHFLRFLLYSVAAMSYLEYFLYVRGAVLWSNRKLPSYLGPSHLQLVHLFVLLVVNSLTLFALSILFVRTLWSLGSNTTTIENWEIERHHTLLRRARHFGGFLDGPDGVKVRIVKQEFPYDIGIWSNICQGMGSRNPLAWFWPFSRSPIADAELTFEVNGFEELSTTWPPPDPDRIPRKARALPYSGAFVHGTDTMTNQETIEAFQRRQQDDLNRRTSTDNGIQRRRPFHQRLQANKQDGSNSEASSDAEQTDGEESWRNSEGERLADFGVDEVVEFYDDDVPLGELLRRRGVTQQQ